MASVEVASRPQERATRRRPFANFVKRLAHFKGNSESQERSNSSKKSGGSKNRKQNAQLGSKSKVYPESGHLAVQQQISQPSFSATSRSQYGDHQSYSSLPDGFHDRDISRHGNRSGAPTLATNPETIHSDAGQSKAATTTTGGGALSSIGGAGVGSTFSSPNQSERSLATTLTTLQSTTLNHVPGAASGQFHNQQSQPMGSMFTHQFPSSPVQNSPATASAIPRHMTSGGDNIPTTYNSATAGNLLSDNASILTLASSSKRRRRSMDTDASVRAMAPSSVWGGSRESLPLSVLSGHYGNLSIDPRSPANAIGSASAERASVYSASGGGGSGLARDRDSTGVVTAPALTSERNSYYAAKASAGGDAKSLRSITTNMNYNHSIRGGGGGGGGDDARSQYDARSITNIDARSMHDVASLRSLAPSEARHARNDSIPGSIGPSPVTPAPGGPPGSLLRQASGTGGVYGGGYGGGPASSLSRRSSDWRPFEDEADEEGSDVAETK